VSGAVAGRSKGGVRPVSETEVADVCDIFDPGVRRQEVNVGQCTYLYANDRVYGQFSAEALRSVWQPCGNRNAAYDVSDATLSIQVNDTAHATVGYDYLYRLASHPHVDPGAVATTGTCGCASS